ncbi:uncharacterized protein [Epargyreus clarus]|uniref:uncharacterized protein n=1 Tax=Epargyreus clarus TaxID=520877 RepID=UPI003C2E6D3C
MASVVCLCIALLVGVSQAAHVVKGLYCKDPDTGKLYAANSTWPSQTFCGNYTCKLRRKNITETQYLPIHKIDISNYNIHKDSENEMHISPSVNSLTYTQRVNNDKQPIYHKGYIKTKEKDPIFNKESTENDRYLTEAEIKTITDMLHTVKKSDLEAIVDIYNLAQDIYKEIDSSNADKLVKETIEAGKLEKMESTKDDKQSYWYEPLQYHNKHIDMSHEATNAISTKKPPSKSNPTYFSGPLSDKDFGKLPYYYPISSFQRLSSYVHTTPSSKKPGKSTKGKKPCKKPANNYNYIAIPWYVAPPKKPEPQVMVQPSTLLPYPFSYIYHYNVSGYPSSYYYNYPWAHPDYSKHRSYPQSYYGPYVAQIPSYSPYIKTEKEDSSEKALRTDLFEKLMESKEENKGLPDWQTAPLSEKVLNEVRAHVDKPKSLKPIPLRKIIKSERVGKVIKLDDLTRTKRGVINDVLESNNREFEEDEFEAYLDRTTCEDSTELGYFRIGNLTQPYPACCPQKIDLDTPQKEVINVN